MSSGISSLRCGSSNGHRMSHALFILSLHLRKMSLQQSLQSLPHHPSNQSMKPTAPLRCDFSVFATTPSTSSRFPASLVRFASSRSRTPAVMLLLNATVAYLFLVRCTFLHERNCTFCRR